MTPDLNTSKPDQIYKGILYACTAFFMFTAMSALNKLLVGQHNAVEVAFYRNFLCLIPSTLYILLTRRPELLKTTMPVAMTARVLIGTLGLVFTLAAVQYLPISNATVLFFTSTLLIPVMAHFFLKEHIGLHRWIAVGIGMTGVIIVAQPSAQMTLIGVALALGAAFVHATIQVLIRAMKTENPFTITYYFFLGGFILPGIAMPFIAHIPSWDAIPILLGVGLTGGLGQYFLTRGFQMAPASLLGPFNYTGLLWATLFDVVIWGYIPGWSIYAGGFIILSAQLYIIHRERQVAKSKRQQETGQQPQE